MSTETELARISQAKSDLKTAIEAKGVEVGDGRIDTYAGKVAEIAGITPTGTINITENGEDIDVATYAKANVNVSGGGGGIPDRDIDFIQNSAVPSSFQTSMSIATDGDITSLFFQPANTNHKYRDSNGDNRQADTAKYLGNDNLWHCPVTVNGQTMDFTSYDSFSSSIYPDSFLYLETISSTVKLKGTGCTCKFDFDNAIEWNTNGETCTYISITSNPSTEETMATGKLYLVPYKPIHSDLASKNMYLKLNNSTNKFVGQSSIAHKISSTAVPQSWQAFCAPPSRTATGSDNCIKISVTKYGVPKDRVTATDYILGPFQTTEPLANAFGYCMLFIKDGKTLSDAKTDFEQTYGTIISDTYQGKFYMEDDVEKQITQADTGTPQSQTLQDTWAAIVANKPSTVTISIPSGDTTGNKFSACIRTATSVMLSSIVDSLKGVTLNYFDSEMYETTKHPLAIMQVDDLDISGITQLYNSQGMY